MQRTPDLKNVGPRPYLDLESARRRASPEVSSSGPPKLPAHLDSGTEIHWTAEWGTIDFISGIEIGGQLILIPELKSSGPHPPAQWISIPESKSIGRLDGGPN